MAEQAEQVEQQDVEQSQGPTTLHEVVPTVASADPRLAAHLGRALARAPQVRLVDMNADASLGRTVFTAVGEAEPLLDAMVELGRRAADGIDLRKHRGAHPRVGVLDVAPLVPLRWAEETTEPAALEATGELARSLAKRLADEAGLTTTCFGHADPEHRSLQELRKGGLEALLRRIDTGEIPAITPATPRHSRLRTGVTCVGARPVLVTLNVELATGEVGHARRIANQLVERDLPAVRVLGLRLDGERVRVSLDLLDHRRTSPETAWEAVRELAEAAGLTVLRSELVGCAPATAWPTGLADRIHEPDVASDKERRRMLDSWLPGGSLEEDPGLVPEVPALDEGGEAPPDGAAEIPESPTGPVRLLDLPLDEAEASLRELVDSLGERSYRAGQVLHAVYRNRSRDIARATTLPASLREQLGSRLVVGQLGLAERALSSDGTVKYLWTLSDGPEIESVAIPSERRTTFCVSSQVGCALTCNFCATGHLGLQRNLRVGEIVDQVLAMLEDGRRDAESLNVVFMGMGEPGYNLQAVLSAVGILTDPNGLGIGARHVTISTAGVSPAIHALAEEKRQVRLAVSLHSAVQETREGLMNVARRHPLPELLAACKTYHAVTRRFITFEAAVLPGTNDTEEEIRALGEFASQVPSKINLIPYNPIEQFEGTAPTAAQLTTFKEQLARCFKGEVMIRRTRGQDIEAACGMLHRARSASASAQPETEVAAAVDGEGAEA